VDGLSYLLDKGISGKVNRRSPSVRSGNRRSNVSGSVHLQCRSHVSVDLHTCAGPAEVEIKWRQIGEEVDMCRGEGEVIFSPSSVSCDRLYGSWL